jgi:RNA polymerase sigma-70 factor (ECF subfamily)
MSDIHTDEWFVQLLTSHQNGLFAYLVALLGDLHEASNVLQETNLVLWRKAGEFADETDFVAWSRKVAYFQVLAYLRDRKRDRHLFDEELLAQLSCRVEPADEDARRLALRSCLAELPDVQRQMIAERYAVGGSVQEMARRAGKSEAAIKMALLRIRQSLLRCISGRLAVQS